MVKSKHVSKLLRLTMCVPALLSCGLLYLLLSSTFSLRAASSHVSTIVIERGAHGSVTHGQNRSTSVTRQDEYSGPSRSVTAGSIPYFAELKIDGVALINQPAHHLGSLKFEPGGKLMAVALVPTGAETAGRGKVLVVDLQNRQIIHQIPGFAAEWAQRHPVSASAIPAFDLTVDSVDTDGALLRIYYQIEAGNTGLTRLVRSSSVHLNTPDAAQPMLNNSGEERGTLTYPESIRVIHHAENSCRSVPPGTVTNVPFEQYVAQVVSAEVPASWSMAALQAQAVAVRTYAWYQIRQQRSTYDVTDWANFQVMCDVIHPSPGEAASSTQGMYLAALSDPAYAPVIAMYSAENGHPTLTNPNVNHLQAVPDLFSLSRARWGHGYGLSQWGAQRRATANHGYKEILGHYYSNVYLRNAISPTRATGAFIFPPTDGALHADSLRWSTLLSGSGLFTHSVESTLDPATVAGSNFAGKSPFSPGGDLTGTVPYSGILITTSRSISRAQSITSTDVVTGNHPMSGTSRLSDTMIAGDKVLINGTTNLLGNSVVFAQPSLQKMAGTEYFRTDNKFISGAILFQEEQGIWPLPPTLQHGDLITIQLILHDEITSQRVLTVDQSSPETPSATTQAIYSDVQATIELTQTGGNGIAASLDWIWEGEELFHTAESGSIISDTKASAGQVWQGRPDAHRQGVWYGPYTTILPHTQSYRAIFWLRTILPTRNTSITIPLDAHWRADKIARLDVTDDEGRNILGMRDIYVSDFRFTTNPSPGPVSETYYSPVAVDFHVTDPARGLEFRVAWHGQAALSLDSVQIWTYPIRMGADSALTLNLGHGFGLRTLSLVAFSGADNLSNVFSKTVEASDQTLPVLSDVWSEPDIPPNQPFMVRANAFDPFSGIDPSGIYLVVSGTNVIITETARLSFRENPWAEQELSFAVEGLAEDNYTAYIQVADRASNVVLSAPWPILVRPPQDINVYLPLAIPR